MIGIIKSTDKRMMELCKYLNNYKLINEYMDLIDCDYLILPFKGIDSELYIYQTKLNISYILDNYHIKTIITGTNNNYLNEIINKYDTKVFYLNCDDDFIYRNSLITSEGIFKIISNDIYDSFSNLKILVLGYGNLGRALEKVFSNYKIDIYSNNFKDKYLINNQNNYIKDLDKLNYDIIINTIPSNIIDDTIFINEKALLYDLASQPYGFSGKYKNKAKICPNIPGNIMYEAAGKLVYETIMKKNIINDCK